MTEQGDGTGVPTNDETALEPAGGDVELDEFDARIADLGSPPGPGASAAESDRYNFAVADIEADRKQAYDEAVEDGDVIPTEDTSGERPDVIILDPPVAPGSADYDDDDARHDDAAMGAATP